MNSRSYFAKKFLIASLLGTSAILLGPAAAHALFPPVNRVVPPPPAPVVQPAVVTPVVIVGDPVVIIGGDPDPFVPFDPPDAKTPEPATMISGLIGLALGGLYVRRGRREKI